MNELQAAVEAYDQVYQTPGSPPCELVASAAAVLRHAAAITLANGEIGELLELESGPLSIKWPPLHVIGASLNDDGAVMRYWCSCGWMGGAVPIPDGSDGRHEIEWIARAWRAHYRLSVRIVRADKRLHAHPEHQPTNDSGYSE